MTAWKNERVKTQLLFLGFIQRNRDHLMRKDPLQASGNGLQEIVEREPRPDRVIDFQQNAQPVAFFG